MRAFDLLNTSVVNVFGESALVQRSGFEDVALNGIFDSRYYALDDQGQVGGSTLITTFAFRVADLDAASLGLTDLVPSSTIMTIRGTVYRMCDIKPDGQGMAVAELARA